MNLIFVLDYFASNIIIYISYVLVNLIWYFCFFNLALYESTLILYLPHGIIVLGFLFFGIKIISGLFLSQITFYIILLNYELILPFKDYLIISFCQLICMPLTFFILYILGITIGTGHNYKLDKTNILHVLIITFLSSTILGIFTVSFNLFLSKQINWVIFVLGSFFGSTFLIFTMKVLVNMQHLLKPFHKKD